MSDITDVPSIVDLIALRKWLLEISDTVPKLESRKVYDKIAEINDQLWKFAFSANDTSPWTNCAKYHKVVE